MGNRFSYIICLCILSFVVKKNHAQYHNVWAFGFKSGLDFNTSPPTPIRTPIGSATGEAAASICNENGQLLFTTDGQNVYDRNGDLMPNGRSIGGGYAFSSAQGALIVPMPDSDSLYYIFSMMSWESGTALGTLLYSIVDMTANAGLGSVITTRPVKLHDFLTEHMIAIAGLNCDVWVLTFSRQENVFKVFNVNASGISTPVSSPGAITLPHSRNDYIGHLASTTNGEKIAIAQTKVVLYDFDKSTGLISEPVVLASTPVDGSNDNHYGICFSPDNTKLYYTAYDKGLVQVDLTSGDSSTIVRAQIVIDTTYKFGGLQRAPDGKIYGARNNMQIIHSPNELGLACNFDNNGISIMPPGDGNTIGMPNLISFAGQYADTFISSNIVNVCFKDRGILSPVENEGKKHIWSTGATSKTIEINTPGTYWVQYKTSCYVHIDTFVVDIFNPQITANSACFNQPNGEAFITFNTIPSQAYRAYWLSGHRDTLTVGDSVFNLSAGNYYVTIQSDQGCKETFSVNIESVNQFVHFSASDTIVCVGETVNFTNHSDTHYVNFIWWLDTSIYHQERNADIHFDSPGVYRIRLAGQGEQCTDTAYQTIYVDGIVSDDWKLGKSADVICVGEAVAYDLPYNDSTLLALTWQLGDNAKYTTKELGVKHAYDKEGELKVLLTAHFRACPDIELYQSIKVLPAPKVFIGHDTTLCLQGKPLVLKNYFPAEAGQKYLWSTGDTVETLRILYPGKYSLRVTGNNLCTTTETIEVDKNCYVDIPNAFTPNGDGINDYFFPRKLLSNGVVSFRLEIFNRWGELIFETNKNEGLGWDGKYNGSLQPSGVYIYRMEVVFQNNNREQYQGSVTLIR